MSLQKCINSHYEGLTTRETFNYSGKTDILIRFEDKNIFIAECKFWAGTKHFTSTIDQILGYLSWRDTKAAIFLFSRKHNFSQILSKIEEITKSHKFFKRAEKSENKNLQDETIFSYVFQNPTDINKEVFLTVLAFNIPNWLVVQVKEQYYALPNLINFDSRTLWVMKQMFKSFT